MTGGLRSLPRTPLVDHQSVCRFVYVSTYDILCTVCLPRRVPPMILWNCHKHQWSSKHVHSNPNQSKLLPSRFWSQWLLCRGWCICSLRHFIGDTTVDEQACTLPASVHVRRNALTLAGISHLCCGSKPPNRSDFFAYPMGLFQAGGFAVREGSCPLVHPLFTGILPHLSLTEVPSRNVQQLL